LDLSLPDILDPVNFEPQSECSVTSYVQRVSLLQVYRWAFHSTVQERPTYYQNIEYNKEK